MALSAAETPEPAATRGWVRRLSAYMLRHRRDVYVASGAAVLGAACQTIVPLVEREIVDKVVVAHRSPLWPWLVALVVLGVAAFWFAHLRRYFGGRVALSPSWLTAPRERGPRGGVGARRRFLPHAFPGVPGHLGRSAARGRRGPDRRRGHKRVRVMKAFGQEQAEVEAGSVKVDGHDLREVSLQSLRREIGVVFEESFLFSDTVRNNIAYGRPDATQEEVEEVAKAAQAHGFSGSSPTVTAP